MELIKKRYFFSSYESATGPYPEAKEHGTTHPITLISILILSNDLRILFQGSHPFGFRNEWQRALHELIAVFTAFIYNFHFLFSPKF